VKRAKREEVVITLGGKPVVKVMPVEPRKDRAPGRFEGRFSWASGAFDPLTDDELTELGFE